MPTSLGPAEIIVILVLALIVLGPKRLPDAGRQVGRFVSEIRHWSSAVQTEIRDAIDLEGEPPPPPPTAAPNALPAAAPPAVPTPADLGTPTSPSPAATPPAASTSASEWGLSTGEEAAHTEEAPPPTAAEPTVSLPPEWSTPPPNSEN
jgi:sec-independent protein translocase protein TatA